MKKLFAMLLVLTMALSFIAVSHAETTLDDLKASFALNVETEELTKDELIAKGKAYETGDGAEPDLRRAMGFYTEGAEKGSESCAAALEKLKQKGAGQNGR